MTITLTDAPGRTDIPQDFVVEAPGLGRYDIRVGLPPGYGQGDAHYPVIYVLDGHTLFGSVHGIVSMFLGMGIRGIVVGIGYPFDGAVYTLNARRAHDFLGPWDMTDPAGQQLREFITASKTEADDPNQEFKAGGAARFMEFIRDELHVALKSKFRIDDQAKHSLIGHSLGGHFVIRALLDPDSLFRRYICISPGLAQASGLEALEAEYAAAHDDLQADLFVCAGEYEMKEGPSFGHNVSCVTWLMEKLRHRAYPGLRIDAEVMSRENHSSVVPRAVMTGLLWNHRMAVGTPIEEWEMSQADLEAALKS